jgi:hypothetical protein
MHFDVLAAIGLKLVAAFCGAILALIFQPPKSRVEFYTRAAFSVMSGIIWAGTIRSYLTWPLTWETEIAAGALTALLSWWLMGAVVRIIGAWNPK